MAVRQERIAEPVRRTWAERRRSMRFQRAVGKAVTLVILTLGALLVMLPLAWMISTALKTNDASTAFPPQWIPRDVIKVDIDGKSYFLYTVTVDGETKQMALMKMSPGNKAFFADPANPAQQIEVSLDNAKRVEVVNLHWENFPEAMTKVPFIRYLYNSLVIVGMTTLGVLISCILVAYGFSRFRARWLNVLFLILLSTIMLPPQVTLIPTFVLFQKLGWYDTFLPLIVPAFFANAWDVFLLRQFFMTVPIEMDEAAKIDGAGPLSILWHVLLPQAWPAVATVAIFHFLYAWNDFFGPLIYLQTQAKWTVALGLQSFQALYSRQYTYMMAAATVTMMPCLLLFFFAQRRFIQGVVITGIKG